MLSLGMIDAATVNTRTLRPQQMEALVPLVRQLANWTNLQLDFRGDPRYAAACRESARARIGEDLATAMLAGKLAAAVEAAILALDARDRDNFRRSNAPEIAQAVQYPNPIWRADEENLPAG